MDNMTRVMDQISNLEDAISPILISDLSEQDWVYLAEWCDKQNRASDFRCLDCRVNTHDIREYYMVTNEVWSQAFPDRPSGAEGRWWNLSVKMLCVGCLENRIGRELTNRDFKNVPINTWFDRMSDRLFNAIQRTN